MAPGAEAIETGPALPDPRLHDGVDPRRVPGGPAGRGDVDHAEGAQRGCGLRLLGSEPEREEARGVESAEAGVDEVPLPLDLERGGLVGAGGRPGARLTSPVDPGQVVLDAAHAHRAERAGEQPRVLEAVPSAAAGHEGGLDPLVRDVHRRPGGGSEILEGDGAGVVGVDVGDVRQRRGGVAGIADALEVRGQEAGAPAWLRRRHCRPREFPRPSCGRRRRPRR